MRLKDFKDLKIFYRFLKIIMGRLNRTVISAARNVRRVPTAYGERSAYFLWRIRPAVRERLGNTYPLHSGPSKKMALTNMMIRENVPFSVP